jgi:hypothetical protein
LSSSSSYNKQLNITSLVDSPRNIELNMNPSDRTKEALLGIISPITASSKLILTTTTQPAPNSSAMPSTMSAAPTPGAAKASSPPSYAPLNQPIPATTPQSPKLAKQKTTTPAPRRNLPSENKALHWYVTYHVSTTSYTRQLADILGRSWLIGGLRSKQHKTSAP